MIPNLRVVTRSTIVCVWLVLLGFLFVLLPRTQVSAHAHLVRADPAPDAVIAHAPSTAQFVFDQPLNPALTSVRLTDARGYPVPTSGGHVASGHDSELYLLPLPPLPDGTYTVYWTSESATDGHIITSFYTFQVAPTGGVDAPGDVTGAAEGVYLGQTASGRSGLSLSSGAVADAFWHWIGLVAQALWLGILIVEWLVLGPARRGDRAGAALAWAAAPRLWRLLGLSAFVALVSLVGEVVSLALEGTDGDWGRALSATTITGILSSQNGLYTIGRLVLLLIALGVLFLIEGPTAVPPETSDEKVEGWGSARYFFVGLALVYMALVALAGHAADVSPAALAVPIDWLHLVCTAAWAGGIGALALGVMPLRRVLEPDERPEAVLSILDRFSPVAYVSVGVLALSGLYNAVVHVGTPPVLVSTAYGWLLIVKVALVGLLIVLSASHVYILRPRIARLSVAASGDAPARAELRDRLGALAGRLRFEGLVGAAILLATALMTQTLPPSGTTAGTLSTTPSITGTAAAGNLSARLTVAPPSVGATTFTLSLRQGHTALDENTAAALIHLYPVDQTSLRANLNTQAHGTQFVARGSLAREGAWRADVLVRTATMLDYQTLPFTFTVGYGATFVVGDKNTAGIHLKISPGTLGAPSAVVVSGVRAKGLRLISESLDMRMGQIPYIATKIGAGRWRATGLFPLMQGRWGLSVQIPQGNSWATLRQFVYEVPIHGTARFLTSNAGTAKQAPEKIAIAPSSVNWRGLPYRAIVSFVDNGLVYVPGDPTLVHVGTLNHSIAWAPDGTVWVTDYEGNSVAVLDPATGAILARIPVGIYPVHMAFEGGYGYVSNSLSNDVYIVNVRTRTVVKKIEVVDGLRPHAMAVSPDGRQVWVTYSAGGGIYIIDTRTKALAGFVPTGGIPHAVAFSPDGRTAYMTDATPGPGSTLMVIDVAARKRVAVIPIGTGSAMDAMSPDGRYVYVTGQSGHVVTVVSTATRKVIARIPVGKAPHGLVFTPDAKLLYVASNDSSEIDVIDWRTNRLVRRVAVPGRADELVIEPR